MLAKELVEKYNIGERNFNGIKAKSINLSNMDFNCVHFCNACLKEANFGWSKFICSDFNGANLSNACLFSARFSLVNFNNVNFNNTIFEGASFYKVNFSNTILDPFNKIPETDLSELEQDNKYVYAYRTKRLLLSNNKYIVGNCYVAPYFSIDVNSTCHPGIYFSTIEWVKRNYPNEYYVKVKAFKNEVLKVGSKYRAKRIWVLKDL